MEGKTSRFILIFLLVFSTSLVWAQASLQKSDREAVTKKTKPSTKDQKSAKEGPEKLWLERAESLTEAIREEEWRLRKQRPLLLARLAEAWWRVDIKKARPWMDAAVSEFEFHPQNESVTDSVKRIHVAEIVLGIVVPLDRSYTERLLETVTVGIEHVADSVMSPEDRQEFGRLKLDLPRIADAAVREKNLQSADRVFRTLLKLRDGNGAGYALRKIRSLDANHSDALYAGALESARAGYDPQLIFGLGQFAYPFSDRGPGELPSEPLRKRFLDLFADAVLRLPQSEEDQTRVCELSRGGGRLIDKYPPEQMVAMRSVVDDCKRRQPTEIEKQNPEMKLESMDDFLGAAEKDPDASQRGYYKSWAARKADSAGQSLRALEIIRSLTEEERQGYPQWASEHMNYEQDAMRELYKSHDLPGLQKLMDNSPRRPQTLLFVSNMLFAAKEDSFALLILSDARSALAKTQADEPLSYWSLLGAYAKYIPAETPAVLKEVVTGLNGIKPPVFGPNVKFKFWWGQFADDLRPWPMPNLLDLDPQYVSETVKLLDSVENRTAFRLSLLNSTLQRYQREKVGQQQKQARPAKSKGRDTAAPLNH